MNFKDFQNKIRVWMLSTFGEKIPKDTHERNCRFLEEAIELVQACGMPKDDAHKLVDYVYNRPIGDPPQEVGGVIVTLVALCLAHDMDLGDCAETEMRRIWLIKDKIAAKQVSKNLALSHADAESNRQEHIARLNSWVASLYRGARLCTSQGYSGDARSLRDIVLYFQNVQKTTQNFRST